MGRGAGGSGGGGGGFDRGGGAYISRERILAANKHGLEHPNDEGSYYTPALEVAKELGRKGIDLKNQPDVTGYRYGKQPDSGLSTNYAEGRSERGLSLANLKGKKPVGSVIWFADRKRVKSTGMLLPYKGSDGEPLILSYQTKHYD